MKDVVLYVVNVLKTVVEAAELKLEADSDFEGAEPSLNFTASD